MMYFSFLLNLKCCFDRFLMEIHIQYSLEEQVYKSHSNVNLVKFGKKIE